MLFSSTCEYIFLEKDYQIIGLLEPDFYLRGKIWIIFGDELDLVLTEKWKLRHKITSNWKPTIKS